MTPDTIISVFKEQFGYPERPLIAQVATLTKGTPDLRSMRLLALDPPFFGCHTGSNKWRQLSVNPTIAAIFLHPSWSHQIILRGNVMLWEGEEHESFLQPYWERLRPDVKKIHIDYEVESDYKPSLKNIPLPKRVPKNFGMIVVSPLEWEMVELDGEDYPSSSRHLYHRKGDSWKSKRINVG